MAERNEAEIDEAPTLRAKTDVLAEHISLAGARVIDVGSGAGELVRWMRSQGSDALGVECGPVMRARALAADPDHPESYVDGVGQDLPLPDAEADAVTFCYSLHHVPADEMVNALREAHRVLRPGGTLYVLEPVPAGPGFEVTRLVDDETTVRGLAQDALNEAEGLGFSLSTTAAFVSEYVYADVAAWEDNVVGIDPSRSERMAAHRAEVSERFYRLGEKVEHGWRFLQPNDLKVYVKR